MKSKIRKKVCSIFLCALSCQTLGLVRKKGSESRIAHLALCLTLNSIIDCIDSNQSRVCRLLNHSKAINNKRSSKEREMNKSCSSPTILYRKKGIP
jgi:hypothetical protein